VGLDVDALDDYRQIMRDLPSAEFYLTPHAPVGPYVLRQQLAGLSTEDFLVFHDSDDVSTSDRFWRLRAEIARTGCDFVGSHECLVDEIEHEVRVRRFPLDACEALRGGVTHSLLHPASMISRSSFWKAGGFSTDQIISNDTQFLLRAYFQLQIRNVDSFLYVRRRHSGALTVAPNTAICSALRESIEAPWRTDFESVKRGLIHLQESSLRCRSRPDVLELIRLHSQ